MVQLLPYIQVVLSILLVAGILLQRSEAGLGAAFGTDNMGGGANFIRRGFEKFLFNATIVVAILFSIVSFSYLLL